MTDKRQVIGRAWVRIDLQDNGHFDMQSFMDTDPNYAEHPPIVESEMGLEEAMRQAGYIGTLFISLFRIALMMHGTISNIMEWAGRLMPLVEIWQRMMVAQVMANGAELPDDAKPEEMGIVEVEEGEDLTQPTTSSVKLKKR